MYDCVCVCTRVRVCVCMCARFPHNHWPPGSHGLDLEVFVNFVLSCEGERLPWAQPRGPSPSTSQAMGFPTCRCFFPAALSLSCSFPPGPQSVPNSRGSTPRPGDPTGGDWPGDRCCGAHSGDPDQGSGRESAGEARPSEKGAVAPGSQDDCDQPPSGGHRPGSAESCRCHSQSRQKWGQGVPRGSRSPSFAKAVGTAANALAVPRPTTGSQAPVRSADSSFLKASLRGRNPGTLSLRLWAEQSPLVISTLGGPSLASGSSQCPTPSLGVPSEPGKGRRCSRGSWWGQSGHSASHGAAGFSGVLPPGTPSLCQCHLSLPTLPGRPWGCTGRSLTESLGLF